MQRKSLPNQLNGTQLAALAVLTVDTLDVAAIFATFTREAWHQFLVQTGHYIFFPIAAAASVVLAVLSWRQAYKDRETRSIVRASVDTVTMIGIAGAVIGAALFTAVMAPLAPIIFAAILGAKALFNAGSAIYYLGKSTGPGLTPEAKSQFRKMAIESAIGAGIGLLFTAAITTVMIFAKFALAGLGIAAGIAGAAFAVYKGVSTYKAAQKKSGYSKVSDIDDSGTELAVTQNKKPLPTAPKNPSPSLEASTSRVNKGLGGSSRSGSPQPSSEKNSTEKYVEGMAEGARLEQFNRAKMQEIETARQQANPPAQQAQSASMRPGQ